MNRIVDFLRMLTQVIAIFLGVILIAASALISLDAIQSLIGSDPKQAVLDALFVAIVLELFYVLRSFVTRGSMNVGAIVSVGIIAAVKELIFKLDVLTLQISLAFAAIFVSLGLLYVIEVIYYEKKRKLDEE